MTDEERERSERQRKLIWSMSRAANPQRPNRVIPARDRDEELGARLGFTIAREDKPVDWKALTAGA